MRAIIAINIIINIYGRDHIQHYPHTSHMLSLICKSLKHGVKLRLFILMCNLHHAEPKNNRCIRCRGYLTFMCVLGFVLWFSYLTSSCDLSPFREKLLVLVLCNFNLLVSRFSYSIWDLLLCLCNP